MKKVAVVEDNEDNSLLLQAILEDQYCLEFYETGMAAIAGIEKEKPDIVLLDISLPEMDGTEVLKKLRSKDHLKNLPIVALTAHAMTGDKEKFLSLGFNDYLAKPITDENLLLEILGKWTEN